MRTYVINLDCDTARWERFQATNSHVKTERISAVDGAAVRGHGLDIGEIFTGESPGYSNSALGCLLSHLSLWKVAEEIQETITVCEDDAVLSENFETARDSILNALPDDWHICMFMCNFDQICFIEAVAGISGAAIHFDQAKMRRNIQKFRHSAQSTSAPYRLLGSLGTACYMISPLGAEVLPEKMLPIRKFAIKMPVVDQVIPNMGLDVALCGIYPQVNAFMAFPPIAVSPNI